MLNSKLLRPILLIIVAAIHVLLLLNYVFKIKITLQETPEPVRVMRVFDLDEQLPPPPPPPPRPPPPPVQRQTETLQVESIAEIMVETDEVPDQEIVAPGTIVVEYESEPAPPVVAPVVTPPVSVWDEYLPIHRVSDPPKFNEREIMADVVYPPIAQRSGIEGQVILELFVDRNGVIQQVRILQETPPDRGFGEAAVRAFTGKRGTPASADGVPVAARFRYPVRFTLR